MPEFEIFLPADQEIEELERLFDAHIAQSGLRVSLRATLKKFPGCIHWHLKQGRQPGTLELTLWPHAPRGWFTVQKGRNAPWIAAEIERLDKLLGGAGEQSGADG